MPGGVNHEPHPLFSLVEGTLTDDIPRLYVRNWNLFQHYKDRNPPWIKLHRSLVSNPEFLSMPEAAQYELIRVWILAASDLGAVPFSTGLIRKMTGMRRIRYLDLLIEKGFLSKSASDLQAPCKQTASPDKNRVEKIREEPPLPPKGVAVEIPPWIPLEAWLGFVEMRKKIRKPLTERAVSLAITKLSELKALGHKPDRVLNQSTMNCWQGLFELKSNGNGSGYVNRAEQRTASNIQAGREALRIAEERDRQAIGGASGSDRGESVSGKD